MLCCISVRIFFTFYGALCYAFCFYSMSLFFLHLNRHIVGIPVMRGQGAQLAGSTCRQVWLQAGMIQLALELNDVWECSSMGVVVLRDTPLQHIKDHPISPVLQA